LVIDLVGGETDPKTNTPMPLQANSSGASTTTTSGVSNDVVSGTDARICSKYQNKVRFEYRLGTVTQEAFSYLTGKFAEWTSAAQGKGLALAYFELTFDRDVYSQIPNVTFEVNGRVVQTVRSDLASSTSLSLLGQTTTGSVTSLATGTGSKTLTLPTDYNYGYAAGDAIEISAPTGQYMGGTVTSYNSTTGQLVINATYSFGSGTVSGWIAYNYTNWGVNPADVAYDYLTNTTFGKGLTAAEIDLDSFKEAGEYCNDYVRENFGATPEVFTRYFINGHLNPDDTVYDNIKKILACCNGYLVYSNGLYYLKINRPRTGTELTTSNLFAFTESNIIGRYDLQLGTKQNRFNQVKVVYFDQDQLYNQNITYYKNSTYLTQDNSQVLEREIEFPMVSDIRNIGYLSRQILNQSRFGMVINFTSSYTALQVEIGDVVRITLDNVGFVDKLFRVMALGLNVDGTIQLTAMEYDDSLFTTGTLPEIPLPGTIIPEAGSSLFTSVVAPPSGVTATATAVTQADGSTLSTIAVSWTAAATAPSTYEIVLSGTSSAIFVTGGSTTTYSISGLPNGTYNVAVRAVNAFGNKSTLVF
jgi:hypothetical protein